MYTYTIHLLSLLVDPDIVRLFDPIDVTDPQEFCQDVITNLKFRAVQGFGKNQMPSIKSTYLWQIHCHVHNDVVI